MKCNKCRQQIVNSTPFFFYIRTSPLFTMCSFCITVFFWGGCSSAILPAICVSVCLSHSCCPEGPCMFWQPTLSLIRQQSPSSTPTVFLFFFLSHTHTLCFLDAPLVTVSEKSWRRCCHCQHNADKINTQRFGAFSDWYRGLKWKCDFGNATLLRCHHGNELFFGSCFHPHYPIYLLLQELMTQSLIYTLRKSHISLCIFQRLLSASSVFSFVCWYFYNTCCRQQTAA